MLISALNLPNVITQSPKVGRLACMVSGLDHNRQKQINVVEERKNAVDKIAGWMVMEQAVASDKILYTTGRLTLEMVIKTALMGIPVLAKIKAEPKRSARQK